MVRSTRDLGVGHPLNKVEIPDQINYFPVDETGGSSIYVSKEIYDMETRRK